jgi:3-oxoadipate enol-lactonase
MPLIDLLGTDFYYELAGDPTLPVVAFSNSLGADLSMWDAQATALRPYFRVLRYDTRGHGRSTMPAGPTTLASLGLDLIALLDALGIEQVHLCGVSLGGLTAMWVALHVTTRLHSLVLSNTAAKIGEAAAWNERIAVVKAGGMKAITDAVPTRWFTPAFVADSTRFQRQKQMLLGCSMQGYVAASEAIRDSDLREKVSSITAPTLIISATDDVATPPAEGRFLQAALAGSEFQLLPGGHLCNIEFPELYNAALLKFLNPQPAERPTPWMTHDATPKG